MIISNFFMVALHNLVSIISHDSNRNDRTVRVNLVARQGSDQICITNVGIVSSS